MESSRTFRPLEREVLPSVSDLVALCKWTQSRYTQTGFAMCICRVDVVFES